MIKVSQSPTISQQQNCVREKPKAFLLYESKFHPVMNFPLICLEIGRTVAVSWALPPSLFSPVASQYWSNSWHEIPGSRLFLCKADASSIQQPILYYMTTSLHPDSRIGIFAPMMLVLSSTSSLTYSPSYLSFILKHNTKTGCPIFHPQSVIYSSILMLNSMLIQAVCLQRLSVTQSLSHDLRQIHVKDSWKCFLTAADSWLKGKWVALHVEMMQTLSQISRER